MWRRVLAVGVACLVGTLSCKNDPDRFECGVRVGEQVAQCDGAGEVCACGDGDPDKRLRRCVRYNEECKDEGQPYSFVFDDECLERGDETIEFRAADPATPANALCPEKTEKAPIDGLCGFFKGGVRKLCGSTDEVCVCSQNGQDPNDGASIEGRCAIAEGACASGYVGESGCIELDEGGALTVVGYNALCPQQDAEARLVKCGVQDESDRIQACPQGQCACFDGVGTCAFESNACASGWISKGGSPETLKCVDEAFTWTTEEGVCPGADLTGAALCGGASTSGTKQSCHPNEICICRYNQETGSRDGVCMVTDTTCLSGHRRVDNGSCLDLGVALSVAQLAASEDLCPIQSPSAVPCGADIAVECGASLGCNCTLDPPLCVRAESECESRVALSGSRRCLPEDEMMDIRNSGSCDDGDSN